MLLNIDMDWRALGAFVAVAGFITTILGIWISKLLTDKKDVVILQQMVKYLEQRVEDLEQEIKDLKNKRR